MTYESASAPLPAAALDHSWSGHFRATLLLGLPLVLSQLAQMAIWVTDTIMLGWLGAAELAASVLGTSLFFVFFIVGSGVSIAVMTLVASAAGKGDVRGARRATRMGLWEAIVYGTVVMLPLAFAEDILLALGQTPELSAMAAGYVRISMFGILPALVALTLRAFLSAVGHAAILLWVTLVGVSVNALLAWTLIFGHFGAPALGLTGAAIGSVGTNSGMALALILYAARKPGPRRFELFVRFFRPDWPALKSLLRLGIPIGMTLLAEVGMFNGASFMMGWNGVIPLAAHGIVLQIASVSFMLPFGLSQAATIRVGQAVGRGDLPGVERAAKTALALGLGLGLLTAILFWLIPEPLLRLFLDESDPDAARIVGFGVPLLGIAAAFQLFDSGQVTSVALLRGIKDARVPMWIAIFVYWGVGLPLGYVLSVHAGYGGYGIWIGLAVALAFAATLMTWRFFHKRERWLTG